MTDSYGQEINVGDLVAYVYYESTPRIGKIRRITKQKVFLSPIYPDQDKPGISTNAVDFIESRFSRNVILYRRN